MTFAWWHILLALVPMLPTFWSLRHIWTHEFENPQQRALWLVLVVFAPVAGGLVYIFVGRKKALRGPTETPQTNIRPAVPADCDRLARLANAAYAVYLERMHKKPAPMTEDYAERIAEGRVFVLELRPPASPSIAGFIVLLPEKDALLLDNVAVDPAAQGRGYGKALLAFAEKKAREAGLRRISLYTNEVMVENLRLYPRLGYKETHRATEKGFNRVFFSKTLAP